jgi:hypothetical protein
MSFLIPLGLLGLLSLLVLLLIYILKPNYQQKLISSTFIWKLSLKYRRKKIPVSKLRNILILICQILILCSAALIMAKPSIVTEITTDYHEEIIVIDASANMRATYNNQTRFARAVSQVQQVVDDTFNDGGVVTIIVAGQEASYLAQRATVADWQDVTEKLSSLECSYTTGDIDGAMDLAEDILLANDEAEVLFYTATHYTNEGKTVKVMDVSESNEWNVAILDAKAVMEDNFYTITVDVACYGVDKSFEVYCEVANANNSSNTVSLPVATVYCSQDKTQQVVYSSSIGGLGADAVPVVLTDNNKIYAFDSIYIHIDEADSIIDDNEYYIYGGNKPTIKIEYYSSDPNPFISDAISAVGIGLNSNWSFEIYEVKVGDEPALEGYDFYFFEHTMPSTLPTDGIVFMLDPDKSVGAGFTIEKIVSIKDWDGDGASLAAGVEHEITKYVDASELRLTQYTQIDESSLDGYDVLLYYQGNPVLFLKNEEQTKIAVMAFNIHYSTINLSGYFSILMGSFFDYFLPVTFEDGDYTVYDTIKLNARGTDLTVIDTDNNQTTFESVPADYYITAPGTYIFSQKLMSGEVVKERLYIKITSAESNTSKTVDVLQGPEVVKKDKTIYQDLIIYFAAAIVALLFIEWLLHSRAGA